MSNESILKADQLRAAFNLWLTYLAKRQTWQKINQAELPGRKATSSHFLLPENDTFHCLSDLLSFLGEGGAISGLHRFDLNTHFQVESEFRTIWEVKLKIIGTFGTFAGSGNSAVTGVAVVPANS